MPQNDYNQSQQELKQFREKLYQSFNYRRDTVMDLVDAIRRSLALRGQPSAGAARSLPIPQPARQLN